VKSNLTSISGGDAEWSDFTSTTDADGNVLYTTSFHKSDGTKHFHLTAHLAQDTITTTEVTTCSNCTSGAGVCQNNVTEVCSAMDSNGICSNSSPCTEEITVVKDELKFSFTIAGWDWKDGSTTHRLHYALELKQKGGDGSIPTTSDDANNDMKTVTVANGGELLIPTTGKIIGGTGVAEIVDVGVTTGFQGDKFIIEFDIPNFGDREFYYDPTISVAPDDSGAGVRSLASLAALFTTGILVSASLL